MKNGWPSTTLGDLCVLTSGGTPSKNNPCFWVGDVPFVSARDLKSDRIESALLHISREAIEESATKLAPVGSLLMLVRGMGLANGIQVGEVTAPVAFNQDIRALHPPLDSVLPRFLLLALRNSFMNGEGQRVLSSAAHGTLKIDTDVLRQIMIPLPPLPEQQRIVGLLDEAFAGIATAKANAEKNLQNARALFDGHLQAVFTQRGGGWVSTTIGDQMLLQRGFDITKDHQIPGNVPVVSSGGIKSFHNKGMANGPGVVIGRKGTLGKVFYLTDEYWPHDTTLWVREFKGNHPRFVYYFFRNLDVVQLDTGTANPALNRNLLHPIRIGWPPFLTQKTVAETLDDLEAETQRLESLYQRKLAALDELKKSLLHRAFSGQL
jgi:type I restriction enzyme S subunit